MAQKVGIRQNVGQRIISGARVAFDPRTTAEVVKTIDGNNYKADEKFARTAVWKVREAEARAMRRHTA